jgi:hypothetical protein
MYDKILKKVWDSHLCLTIRKTPLNKNILQQLLTQPIKILFILCHGEISVVDKTEHSWFCLEDEDDPSVIDRFDEKRLAQILKGARI